ncbi:MAG: DivIVA domain-containing protein, partial [Candidatus Zixiibacteriota bacterium]
MELTPNDIRNHDFPGALRGYDKDNVDQFVEQVATALESAKQENLRLSMEIDSLKSQLSGLKQFEETIKNAAIDARRNADLTVDRAKQEAELILSKARNDAQKIVEAKSLQITEIEERINQLDVVRKSYMTKL